MIEAVILAAGKSRRMLSKRSKVLHKLCGKPLLYYTIRAAKSVHPQTIYTVVGGPHMEEVKSFAKQQGSKVVHQNEPLGTGHAVMQVLPYVRGKDVDLLVLPGDAPLVKPSTIRELYEFHKENYALATILTSELPDPTGYGRIIRSKGDRVLMIVEEADAFPEEKQIKEVNSGIYIFDANILMEVIPEIKPDNKQGEYYLTDVIAIIQRKYGGVYAYKTNDWQEIIGINTREQLSMAHRIMQARIVQKHVSIGVTIYDPQSVYIEEDVQIEPDVVIYPFTSLLGKTYIEEDAEIGPNVVLEDYHVQRGEVIRNVHLKGRNR